MTPEEFQAMFKKLADKARENASRKKLYNRNEAFKLLGFKKSVALTDWLRENNFMSYDDCPDNYLTERGLMDFTMKYVSPRSKYDDNGNDIGQYDYDGTSLTKTFFVPLLTQAGIDYFKKLLADPAELQNVSEEIRSLNRSNSIPLL